MATSTTDAVNEGDTLIVDCDVHQDWASEDEIVRYLPEHFRDRGIAPPGGPGWQNPIASHGLGRNDAVPPGGGPPGSSHELMEAQLFDDFGVDYAVLTGPLTQVRLAVHPNLHYAKAAIEAYNDWLIEEWLERDDRYLGSLMVTPQVPDHAVKEIRRVGSHDQMVQVMLPGADQSPYGHERYWPIYEAAQDEGLPIALHTTIGSTGLAWSAMTSAGLPQSYPERHMGAVTSVMGNLTSTVYEGVFVEYPDLDWVFLEGGFAWLPHFLWKMDKLWKGLKEATPWLDRPPSEYIRDNVWFSTQPVEEPEKPEHLAQMLDMIHADETLVYSSDYPHWDNDNPAAMLRGIDADTRRRIFSENARHLYGL